MLHLFVSVVPAGVGVSRSITLLGGDGAVDLVVVGGVLQGCGPLPLLYLPRAVVAVVVVSLRPLLLLLSPSILMNPLNLFIQTSGNKVSYLLV